MSRVVSLEERLTQLERLHPKRMDLSLGRIRRLLVALDNPEKRLPPIVRIAGTNGKGSTLAFIESIACHNGWICDSYISPHLVRFNERIRLNGQEISTSALLSVLERVEKANAGAPITFFEITTAAAFLAFAEAHAQEKRDLLLLEVGLGGRLDATSAVAQWILSVVTPIDLDHQGFLGSTLEKIAGEKAAIIARRTPAISAKQKPVVRRVLEARADKMQAPFLMAGRDWRIVRVGVQAPPAASPADTAQATRAAYRAESKRLHRRIDKSADRETEPVNQQDKKTITDTGAIPNKKIITDEKIIANKKAHTGEDSIKDMIKAGEKTESVNQKDKKIITGEKIIANKKICTDEDSIKDMIKVAIQVQGTPFPALQNLPLCPSLVGAHQQDNAGLAAVAAAWLGAKPQAIQQGIQAAQWQARLHQLTRGALVQSLPHGWQVWLDGGHNPAAARGLSAFLQNQTKPNPHQDAGWNFIISLIAGKSPSQFLSALLSAPIVRGKPLVVAVAPPADHQAVAPEQIATLAQARGAEAYTADSVASAIAEILSRRPKAEGKILICGSLYQAGAILRDNH